LLDLEQNHFVKFNVCGEIRYRKLPSQTPKTGEINYHTFDEVTQ